MISQLFLVLINPPDIQTLRRIIRFGGMDGKHHHETFFIAIPIPVHQLKSYWFVILDLTEFLNLKIMKMYMDLPFCILNF